MNQGKLEVAKQEMTRVNIDILGISKLKWTGMGEFNTDDHYIYYCGQESLRRNNTYPSETVLENCRVRNTSKFIAQIYHHTDTKTRKKNHKKRKLLANIPCLSLAWPPVAPGCSFALTHLESGRAVACPSTGFGTLS